MIKKFIEIKGVGRFDDYKIKGDLELKPSTIIYAENGYGKTTLTNIIKSLGNKTNEAIIKRKTIGTSTQSINIQTDDSNHIFKNGNWVPTLTSPQIEVFDIFFVNENIHSGFEQSLNHGKNLYKFIIGEDAIKIANEIKILKEEIANQNKALTALGQSIQKEIGGNDFKKFLKLSKPQDLEEKIQLNNKAVEIAKQSENILQKSYLNTLTPITLTFDLVHLEQLFSTTLNTISSSYISNVEKQKEHLGSKGITNSGEWLTQGFKTLDIESKSTCDCPFCDQTLYGSSLIEAYKQYFSEQYIKLHTQVREFDNILSSFNISNSILRAQEVVTGNLNLTGFWEQYTEISQEDFKINFQSDVIDTLFSDIKALLSKKLTNVLESIDQTSTVNFSIKLKQLNDNIEAYNSKIEIVNGRIQLLKEVKTDLSTLLEEERTLSLIKRRFDALDEGCKDYLAQQKTINENNLEKELLQKKLSEETEKFFNLYGEKINEFIVKLMPGANYTLQKLEGTYSGSSKEPAIQYTLAINGTPISSSEVNNGPSFKYTLSEGDKTALAFAFFLSKLEMEDISKKVIVFDDPISSLDKQRRKRTLTAITDLNKRAKQVITLSHNENFIFDLYEHPNSNNPKVLRIVFGGRIENFDNIEEEMQSDYFKSLKTFDDFKDNPREEKIKETRANIRKALENNLKFRFHKYLKLQYIKSDGSKIGPYVGKSGLGNLIDILEASDCEFRTDKYSVLASLRELNAVSMDEHHGTIEKDHRNETMSIPELLGYIKETFLLIYQRI